MFLAFKFGKALTTMIQWKWCFVAFVSNVRDHAVSALFAGNAHSWSPALLHKDYILWDCHFSEMLQKSHIGFLVNSLSWCPSFTTPIQDPDMWIKDLSCKYILQPWMNQTSDSQAIPGEALKIIKIIQQRKICPPCWYPFWFLMCEIIMHNWLFYSTKFQNVF